MQKRNTLSLVLGFVCLFWLNGRHGAYGFNPYNGYLPSGAPAAVAVAYQQPAESARKSTAGAYPGYGSLAYAGASGYPLPAIGYPGAAAAAYNQQQKSSPAAQSYPPPYGIVPVFTADQSVAGGGVPYTMSSQSISIGGAVSGSTVANINNKKDGGAPATTKKPKEKPCNWGVYKCQICARKARG